MVPKHSNALIHETSPYLLQHAHNPVNWVAWSPEVLKQAEKEDKLLIISIGYAACHWCHVMEKECFEDEEVAEVMNKSFVNIKIDREERPDVDHIYMDALQMMTGSGGWPLNIIALPDGRPIWGATYVDKRRWIKALEQLADVYDQEKVKVISYAENLAEGIKSVNLVKENDSSELPSTAQLEKWVVDWSEYFDRKMGGYNRAPKFMMPGNLEFLLHFGMATQNESVLEYVDLTLKKIAQGGVYDHIGGGFARYAVDTRWHVPHFEKMLYDNGQLVSLYAKAYAYNGNEDYKEVVKETISFVERELMDKDSGFYSSLDADSINEEQVLEEGAFYVWRKEELKALLGSQFEVFQDYYNINSYGHWEEGNYVLIKDKEDQEIAKKHSISHDELNKQLARWKHLLLEERAKRERPRLDDKVLTSWNGLMLNGLIDAYRYLGNEHYLELARKNAEFIFSKLMDDQGQLYHNYKNGKVSIEGYLEDYASVAKAYLNLYETTLEEKWLLFSRKLLDYCLSHFYDSQSGLFFFTSDSSHYVIRKTLETQDNVIPSSNSILAAVLFKMGKLYPEENYKDIAKAMILAMQNSVEENIHSHANWARLALYMDKPFYEIAIVGSEYKEKAAEFHEKYLPNTVLTASENEGDLSLLKNRYVVGKTLIYVCKEGACRLPETEAKKALEQILKN
ncbi:MAG: thioredoxin domain-containing protein [Bacteroidota bacterium]